MKLRLTILLFLMSLQGAINAQDLTSFFTTADTFFKTYVKDGLVDYKAINNNPDQLNQLLDLANTITVNKEQEAAYKAFWINVYNLAVIDGIVQNYPVDSPLTINGFFDKQTVKAAGKEITLNEIEHTLLRGNFNNEPRFHFVLVCAGIGCPPLINEAYFPETLDKQLQRQTSIAVNNPNFIKVKGKKVLLSQIFEWYKEDFVKNGQTYISFLNQFRKEKLNEKMKVSFYPYDWTLNAIN